MHVIATTDRVRTASPLWSLHQIYPPRLWPPGRACHWFGATSRRQTSTGGNRSVPCLVILSTSTFPVAFGGESHSVTRITYLPSFPLTSCTIGAKVAVAAFVRCADLPFKPFVYQLESFLSLRYVLFLFTATSSFPDNRYGFWFIHMRKMAIMHTRWHLVRYQQNPER